MTWVTDPALAGMNLNQLVALDALLDECNVRLAAERMGVTQSAMSHTLRGLRELLGDPLLVRVGNCMVPTEHAEQLAGHLRRGLSELERVVRGRAAFEPTTIRDEFTVAIDASTGSVLAPDLRAVLHDAAPHARLSLPPFDPPSLHGKLLSGEVDVAVVPPVIDLAGLHTEPTLPSAMCVLVREGHPRVGKRLSLAAFCETPHAMVTLSGKGVGPIDAILARLGRERTVVVRVPHLFALPDLIASSELIATVPPPRGPLPGRALALARDAAALRVGSTANVTRVARPLRC